MGAIGKGCRVKPKWGRQRMDGGERGPCWGKALGLSLADMLLQLLPALDPAPSSPAVLRHRERGQSGKQGLASRWRLPALGTAGFPLNQ